jgi:hypothetical protein
MDIIMTEFEQVVVDKDGWSEVLEADLRNSPHFQIACCDCGLVHDYEFKVMFRLKRNDKSTAKVRRATAAKKKRSKKEC